MDVRFVYDLSYVKQILKYLGIPFLIFLVVSGIILLIYSLAHKDHDDPKYKYNMNLYTLLMSIVLVASLFAVLVGFAFAFKKQADAANIQSIIVYIVLAAPLLPFISLIALFAKTIKLMKNKPTINSVEEKNNESIPTNSMPINTGVDVNITEVNNQNLSNSLLDIPPASSNMFSAQSFFPDPNVTVNNNVVATNNSLPSNNQPAIVPNQAISSEPVVSEVKIEPVPNEAIKVIEEDVKKNNDIETL